MLARREANGRESFEFEREWQLKEKKEKKKVRECEREGPLIEEKERQRGRVSWFGHACIPHTR